MRRLIIGACLLLPLMASAQQVRVWSLKDCMDYAIDNNISVKQSKISVELAEVDLNTDQWSRMPDLSGSASENFSFGRGLTADNTYANANTTSTSFSLGGSIPVFQGFRINRAIAQDKLNITSLTAKLDKAKDDIRVSVAQAYIEILYDKEILQVAASQVVIDSLQVERLETKALNGSASRAELSAQRATLAESRVSLAQAEGNLSLALLELTQLLELPSPEGFDIVSPSVETLGRRLLMSPEGIYAEAVGIKPVVKAGEADVQYAKAGVASAKSGWWPSISLSGGIGTNMYTNSRTASASFGDQMKNNFSQFVGLSLSVPIFDRFQTRNSVRQARLRLQNSEYELESAKKGLYKEIQQAYYNALAADSKYESCTLAAESAAESFDLVLNKYEAGKASITEYNEAKNKMLSAESNLVKARYEYLFQSRLLDFYRGDELIF